MELVDSALASWRTRYFENPSVNPPPYVTKSLSSHPPNGGESSTGGTERSRSTTQRPTAFAFHASTPCLAAPVASAVPCRLRAGIESGVSFQTRTFATLRDTWLWLRVSRVERRSFRSCGLLKATRWWRSGEGSFGVRYRRIAAKDN